MPNLGIVGLDTSHCESFATTIADSPDADLVAVWDGGDVRSESFDRTFADRFDATCVDTPGEMNEDVDAVMILTVDWTTHETLATRFLEQDIPTLIDKPIAGSLDDLRTIESAAGTTPIFGGSAVPYHASIESFRPELHDRQLYCVGYDDPFYYGPHLVDTICRIVDEDWVCVSPSDDPGQTVTVIFREGVHVTIRLDSPDSQQRFTFLSIGNETSHVEIRNEMEKMELMYSSYLDAFLDVVAGERSPTDRILDAAELHVAVTAALEHNRAITPECPLLDRYSVDSESFVEHYSPYY